MKTSVEINTVFKCSLERAFKSPMLCDITKVHSGFLMMPKVTECQNDENWGKVGGSRRVFMTSNLLFKGGEAALDTVLARDENKYWKIEVNNFKMPMMGFRSFQGEWFTEQTGPETVHVKYRYQLISNSTIAYPFQWLFAKIAWRIYMKHVLENVRELAYSNAPYLHA